MAKGIRFQPQGANPLPNPTDKGLWIDSSDNLVFEDGTTSLDISTSVEALLDGTGFDNFNKTYLNNSGVGINAYAPVYATAAGTIANAGASSLTKSKFLGIALEAIANGLSGKVAVAGVVPGVTGFSNGNFLYLSDTDGVLSASPTSTLGNYPVRVGQMEGTNLILRPQTLVRATEASITTSANDLIVARDEAGAVGLATGIKVNTDNSTIEIATNAIQVKDLGITNAKLAALSVDTAKLANDTVTGAKINDDVAGAGLTRNGTTKALDTVYAPSIQMVAVAGESFAADNSYMVRFAIDGETSGRIYKASAALASTQGKYLVAGVILPTSALTAGDSILVTVIGEHTLGASDTPFDSADIGKPVYLKNNGTGGFSVTPPSSVDSAIFLTGVVKATTSMIIDIKSLEGVIPIPGYNEDILYASGLAANTPITLPNNSRNGGAAQTYTPSAANLKVWVNGIYRDQGHDWTSIDSSSLYFPFDLPNDSIVTFMIDALSSGVLSGGGGGGGGSTTLDQAYQNGSTINVVSGTPIIINGPASEKLLVVNGDITVTGIIDPTAIQFTPQATSPLSSGMRGIWLDTSSNLMVKDGPSSNTNITQRLTTVESIASNPTTLSRTYTNNTGSTIPAYTPVYSPSAGNIAPADGTNANKFRVIGVTTASISDSASGEVAIFGTVSGISALTHNTIIYLGLAAGSKTDAQPTLGPYPSGFYIVKLGVMEGNNLILQVEQIGTL